MRWNRERRRQQPVKDATPEMAADIAMRRHILALPDLLQRAKRHYRRLFREIGRNPFCQRCTRYLAIRRFNSLCTRCLIGLRGEDGHQP